jgi:glycogen(starch) synthase
MTMRVLQLGPYPPPEGGITRNILAIRDELLSRGDGCSIIATSKSSSRSDEPNVYHPASPVSLIKLLRSLRYDVLHLHVGGDITPRVLALAYACTLFGRGRKLLTVHSGGWPQTDGARNASRTSLAGMVLRRFDHLIAVNQAIADVFGRFGVEEGRISAILPYALTPPDPAVRVPERLSQFYKTHEYVLLAVGGLEPDYDPLLQIRALGEVLNTNANAGLVIAGDGSMRAEVEQAIASSGYAGSIMLAGNVPHHVVLHLIRNADVLLRTTLFDGDAISVREALFLGTPVIATDNGMRPEGVHLVPTGNAPALAYTISRLLASPGERPTALVRDTSNIKRTVALYG